MLDNPIVVDVDELPSSLVPSKTWDYIGIQILGLLQDTAYVQPTFGTEIEECLCREVFVDKHKSHWDLFFDTSVEAGRYYMAINDYTKSKKHPFYMQLNPLNNDIVIDTKKNKVDIKYSYSYPFVKQVLTNPVLGIPSNWYALLSKQNNSIHIHRLSRKSRETAVEQIVFKKYRSHHDAYRAYCNGKVHLTCNTMFPYNNLMRAMKKTDFHVEPSNIFMVLTRGSLTIGKDYKTDQSVRDLLPRSIDRALVAKRMHFL
jgi:hypothetical protein